MSDAARWEPWQRPGPEPKFGRGRAPRMTHSPWHKSQDVELGMTDEGTYRRCPEKGCRIWAGPYTSGSEAKQDGMDHKSMRHRK
jgi:hypothetical protein